MNTYITANLDLRQTDCMELLAASKDNQYDLAIIDPPYGIGESGKTNKTRGKMAVSKDYKPFAGGDLSAPNEDYWRELFRVSKNQIIWGANHFISRIPFDSSCWIVWDKDNGNTDFADCELAWTSFKTAVRKFKWRWQGMLQQDMKNKEKRIHPTQKPVALYKWLLEKYAKSGDKILDTHLGSMSIAVACHSMDFHLTGSEMDDHYFSEGVARIKTETTQINLI